jgi:TM2 domain-containing membrane protein YozV
VNDFDTLFTFLVGLLVALLALTVLVALVYALTGLLNSTRRVEQAAQVELREALAKVPPQSQEAFVSFTNRRAKSPTIAVLLALFLGWLGAHRFYLRDYGLGFMYLAYFLIGIPVSVALVYLTGGPTTDLFGVPREWVVLLLLFIWLGIPALAAFVDAFLMPRQANEKNRQMIRQAQEMFARSPGASAGVTQLSGA